MEVHRGLADDAGGREVTRVGELSQPDLDGLGITPVDGDPMGVKWLSVDGIPLSDRSEVVPLRIVNDERTVVLPDTTPTLPTRYHRSGQVWRPKWLTVRVTDDGLIYSVILGGPVLRLDGEPYADGAWEHRSWDRESWPTGAPVFATAALRWLLNVDTRLRLPVRDEN